MDTKQVKALAKLCFPAYKGRKFSSSERATYAMEDYWDGGSRKYAMAVDLATLKVSAPCRAARNPMNGLAHAEIAILAGVAIVEHVFFCGKDCGIRVYTAPLTVVNGAAQVAAPVAAQIEG